MQKILYEELLELPWYSVRKFRKILALQQKVFTHIEKTRKEEVVYLPFSLNNVIKKIVIICNKTLNKNSDITS